MHRIITRVYLAYIMRYIRSYKIHSKLHVSGGVNFTRRETFGYPNPNIFRYPHGAALHCIAFARAAFVAHISISHINIERRRVKKKKKKNSALRAMWIRFAESSRGIIGRTRGGITYKHLFPLLSSSSSSSSLSPPDKAISQEPIAKASLNLCGTIIDIPWRARLLSGKVRGERAIERNLCEGLAVFRPSRSRCSRTSNRTKVIPNNSTSCLRVARTGSHIE